MILEREGQDCFKSITFKNTELPSEGQDNKAAFVDFLFEATVETEACEYIDLEIQSYYDSSLPNRILYYGAKLLTTSGIKKGDEYQNICKNIVLCIQRKPIHKQDGLISRYQVANTKTHELMTDRLEFVFVAVSC